MDIDTLHSALSSLTVVPEQIRTGRANLSAVPTDRSAAFLDGFERDLRNAKITLARELGFPICTCCWPPEILATDETGRVSCPRSGEGDPRRAIASKIRTKPRRVDRFARTQKNTLLRVRDLLIDSASGPDAERPGNRNRASTFVGDRADAGNDAADRDFALSLISQGRDALLEVEHALKRIDSGTYGICEMSGHRIPRARLEALPAARYTVECQASVEKDRKPAHLKSADAPLKHWDEGEEEEAV